MDFQQPRLSYSIAAVLALSSTITAVQRPSPANVAIDLWTQDKPAFGIFVPRTAYSRDGADALAKNTLYDFLFLNLEGGYDAAVIKTVAEALAPGKATGRKTLIVRIPPISRDGAASTRARVKQAFDLGADGVTLPHIRNVDEAREAIGFFRDAGANVWSASSPTGDKLAMLMIEDPGALAQAKEIADLKGYSILACGIGSLRSALGGDREAAETGNQRILAETKRVKLVNMLPATAADIEQRVKQGYLALIAQGQAVDDVIKMGRAAAGRD